ncbi:signal peptidase I [Candidatus Nomurabacteria bacterium]|nr:MAG: signal peptidase I [Candidatus Nomurabacteria bacterium]
MEENQSTEVATPNKKESIWDVVRFAIIALLIVIPVRTFVAQPFIVSGSSMVPTFQDGEYLIVDEISYRVSEPKRGDVIVFKYPKDETKYFIKRIIGLPGESVHVAENGKVTITNESNPEGFNLNEPYIKGNVPKQVELSYTLEAGEYFVMGDNRPASSDSRTWGTLPEDHIVGKTFLRLFPFSTISVTPGIYHNYEQVN